jgi:hypothetical protein
MGILLKHYWLYWKWMQKISQQETISISLVGTRCGENYKIKQIK